MIFNFLHSTNTTYLKFFYDEINWSVFNSIQFIIYIYVWIVCIYSFYKHFKYSNGAIQCNYLFVYIIFIFSFVICNIFFFNGQVATFWYNHLYINNVNYKFMIYINLLNSIIFFTVSSYFNKNTKYYYDIMSYVLLLNLWLISLFFCLNFFTLIFYFELLTLNIMMLLSLSNNYTNITYNQIITTENNNQFNNKPYYQFYSFILMFWISFLTSFNLFFYLIYYIYYLQTFDFFLVEYVVLYLKLNSNLWLYNIYFIWFGFIFTIFLKLGLIPFFFWKPNFFKGTTMQFLFIYIVYFYYIFLSFIFIFLLNYLNELVLLTTIINLIIIYVGLILLIMILFNTYNIKIFFAYSSIINTLLIFIFLLLQNYNSIQYVYY